MAGRTFAIGDIHGETQHLFQLMSCFPQLDTEDTIVFLGDYVDRGPRSRQVVDYVRALPQQTPARVVALRGNHEDAWLRVLDAGGWHGFTGPPSNGCLAALRSYLGGPLPSEDEEPLPHEAQALHTGSFFDPAHVAWFRSLPLWYEDAHAIYVHAGLPMDQAGHFQHPSEVEQPLALLWCRDIDFFQKYRGKRVVFGHTRTEFLPPELDGYSPEDPSDIWAGENVVGIDTGCGNGGFLTCLELPALNVYESR
jgi:serine/threonine protein phosphatase 1